METGPIAPAWFVLPLAMIALILQAGYLMAIWQLPRDRMPASRRRIRVATGWLIMFAIPLAAYGFGIASPSDPGVFAIVWMMVIALIAAILLLAVLDALNTMRLHRSAKGGLRKEFRRELRRDIEAADAGDGGSP